MRLKWLVSGGCFLLLAAVSGAARGYSPVDRAIALVKPALVRIHVVAAEYRSGKEIKQEAVGSGVIIDKRGYVITNYHVAGKAIQLMCTLSDRREFGAVLVGADPLSDIAVIKLRAPAGTVFPYARFGDSSKLQVGQPVLAMGSPFALSQSVTKGIVSNTALVFPSVFWPFQFTVAGENVGSIVKWIGHDAAIFPGNSGGPLVTLNGRVVGINEISMGLGGAIPANLAAEVAREIIKKGKVVRSWLGLEFQPLLKYSFEKRGVLISGALKGSPAAKAGFRPGDVLVSLAGRPVTVRHPEQIPDFNLLIANLAVGRPVEAVVLRNGKVKALKVTPDERQPAQPEIHELKAWGMDAANLNFLEALRLKRNSTAGVLVTSVKTGGPGDEAKPALTGGAVIVKINGAEIKDVGQLIAVTKQIVSAAGNVPAPVLVQFERKRNSFLTVVNVGPEEPQSMGIEAPQAWLGAATQVLTAGIRSKLGLAGITGVRVTGVYKDGPAAKAGLKTGDLIVSLDGQTIPAESEDDSDVFPAMIRQYQIGGTAELGVLRGKEKMKLKVVLAAAPEPSWEEPRFRDDNFDFEVRDMTPLELQAKNGLKGVIVTDVEEGGWAALAHLAVGDVIVAVQGAPVSGTAGFGKTMAGIAKTKPDSVVLKVRRGIHTMFVQLLPDWSS